MKKKSPPFIEMLHAHYETSISKNTVMVYEAYIEPDIHFENGESKEARYDSILEIRMIPDVKYPFFYIYSSFSGRLWSTRKLDEANTILKREERYVNRGMKNINECERKYSIEKFMKTTEPLLESAQDILNSKN